VKFAVFYEWFTLVRMSAPSNDYSRLFDPPSTIAPSVIDFTGIFFITF